LAFSVLLAFLSLALVSGPVWREGQSKKVPPLSWEEFVETDSYKELPPEKKAEARQRYKEIYGQTVAEWTAGLPDEQSVEAEKLFVMRSEERRVGKEGRSRWGGEEQRKKRKGRGRNRGID